VLDDPADRGLLDLVFGLFREVETWSASEIASCFQEAGLATGLTEKMPGIPSILAQHIGRKPE
jgi:hypothetical protein